MTNDCVCRIQTQQQQDEEGRQRRLVKCALDTLRDADFGPYMLLNVAQDVLLEYTASEDASLRKAAAVAAWRVTERQWALLRCAAPYCVISSSILSPESCRTSALQLARK
jgi:hypothetical protein